MLSAWPLDLSMPLFLLDTFLDWLLSWAYLTLTSLCLRLRWDNVMDLRLDLRVRVLKEAKNNGTWGTRGLRQVRASLRIKTLQISSASVECLASELYYDELDLPVLAKLRSALPSLKLFHWVLLGSGQVLNDSDWIPSSPLKTRIGALRCSPRLPYQIPPRIYSGVKLCMYFKCRLPSWSKDSWSEFASIITFCLYYA
jgi:hypothetical protein